MGIQTRIIARKQLDAPQRTAMYALFAQYYDNANVDRFEADLHEKDWVIQLRNANGDLVGFSTLQVYASAGTRDTVTVLYSGDTIIMRSHRRSGQLAGAFGHLIIRTVREHPGQPVYWLLSSKGVRTYRFLPVFFATFYPAYNRKTPPAIKQHIDDLACEKFGSGYSPERQIVSHCGARDRLIISEHDPVLLQRRDPHVQYFLERNPGYIKGDELVCIAELSEANLNERAWRVIRQTKVTWCV